MDPSTATREIFWNVPVMPNAVIMYLIFAVSLLIAGAGVFRRIEFWRDGKSSPSSTPSIFQGLWNLLCYGLLQKGVIRERFQGAAHALVYIGFLALLFATTMVLIEHDLGIPVFHGPFYLGLTLAADVLGIGLFIGLLLFLHRRCLAKPDLIHTQPADFILLGVLALLVIQGFVIEGLRIRAAGDVWSHYSPIGYLFSELFWGLSVSGAKSLHFFTWWFHALSFFLIFALLPYTKFFHIFSSTLNLYFRGGDSPRGALANPGDIEALMEAGDDNLMLGTQSISDYTWKARMDLDACTSCGRCQDVCPAYASGKPLSPKWLILDTRNHSLLLQSEGKLTAPSILPKPFISLDNALTKNLLLKSSGLNTNGEGSYISSGSFRANNEKVQNSVLKLGESLDARIAGEVMDPNVFWTCNTCYACVEACPVGINHVDQIIENRRNMVLMHGEIPSEAQATLRSLETRGNPYGDPKDRIKWLEDLSVKILSPGDSVDYLYWVGCVSAYDPRKQKIARSLVRLMEAANLDFGILGSAEGCTGDPARRLGEENLFQTLAKQNIETLKSVRFKTIIANCPHCFNTIKNEYPQFGNLGEGKEPEILHHSQLLKKLLAKGELKLNDIKDGEEITFHDPCYLGRVNDEYDAPREVLQKSSLKIVEMERSKEKGMCCGAGGGHFWMDLKIGERVNVIRTDQAAETGAKKIATACPFCMQMMEDGVKLTNREDSLEVKDIAEVLAERL